MLTGVMQTIVLVNNNNKYNNNIIKRSLFFPQG